MTLPLATSETVPESLARCFREKFGTRPSIFHAPGRVNLIGEHTDYNDGFVMPAAIDFDTWLAVGPRDDFILHVESEQFSDVAEWRLDELAGPPRNHWSDHIRGIAALLQDAGHALRGANLLVKGRVPPGAGLSSSASLQVATALALLSVANREMPRIDVVKLCQRAEHEYVGNRCGIMDQFAVAYGRAGHALLLDCRSLEFRPLAIPEGTRLVVCNSMVKHEHAAGEYNRRRADCETGVRMLQQTMPQVRALRDVTRGDLEKNRSALPEVIFRRCRHVIAENERVLAAERALRNEDLAGFGQLMYESHRSLRDDYEVSCRELDVLVDLAAGMEGVYGARMTGGGFGGCTINLVRVEAVKEFERYVMDAYAKAAGKTPEVYICSAAQGAGPWHD